MLKELFPILSTTDLPRALAFYRDLLGFTVTYRFPDEGDPAYVGLRLGQSELGITLDTNLPARPEPSPTGGTAPDRFVLCGYVDDCDAAVEKLRAHGVTILTEPANQPWGERMAEVADPDGNRIALMARL